MIYLDNNATTPLHPAVFAAMRPFLETLFANPSSSSAAAREAQRAIALARKQVATLLGCEPQEIIFTSGGTEANNTAISSATELFPHRKHIVTASTEHDAVRHYLDWLEAKHGYEITRLPVSPNGEISPTQVAAVIRPGETALVTLMWANNETGVLHPIQEMAELAASHDVLFHTDAVQAVGKMPLNLRGTSIHTLALSGHKIHGPKGIGALYLNQRTAFQPWMLGGGQENFRRAGTENVAGIVGLGIAASLALETHHSLRDQFEKELHAAIPDVIINGGSAPRLPNTSNILIPGTQAEGMMILLEKHKICVSAGSACHAGALHPSHVLEAMGLDAAQARSCLRVSFSRMNRPEEITEIIQAFVQATQKMRTLLGS
jgi:cysteine desulfurase